MLCCRVYHIITRMQAWKHTPQPHWTRSPTSPGREQRSNQPPSHGIFLHSWQHVSIDIRSHRNITMPHYLLNHLQGNSHTCQQCYRAMPKVMKTHIIEALTQLLAFTL